MKKRLKVYGMIAIIALTMGLPLTAQKVDAHTSDGKPSPATGIAIRNMPTRAKHSGHMAELISVTRGKKSACYETYQCLAMGCMQIYQIYIP